MKPKRSPLSPNVATPVATARARRVLDALPVEVAPKGDREVIRRKPEALRKATQLHIRINDETKEALTHAAAREGLELSAWVRATLLKAAGLVPK